MIFQMFREEPPMRLTVFQHVQHRFPPALANGLKQPKVAGQSLDADGRWVGHRVVTQLLPSANGYELTVPRYSAALVSVGGTLASARHERARPQVT